MPGKIRVLIVDDELKFLNSVTRRLELRGFEVSKAVSGAEALECASRNAFDLALLDLKMPGMDGRQVLQRLKKEHPLLEVIIITGHGATESAAECMKAGAFSYLPKPYELERLLVAFRQAYAARLKKKFQNDPSRMFKLAAADQIVDALAGLRAMSELNDDAE